MILITNAARLSRAPPNRFSHDTTEILSLRKSTVPPAYSGKSFSIFYITNVNIIIPVNSSRFIVIGPAFFVADCLFNSKVGASASE